VSRSASRSADQGVGEAPVGSAVGDADAVTVEVGLLTGVAEGAGFVALAPGEALVAGLLDGLSFGDFVASGAPLGLGTFAQ